MQVQGHFLILAAQIPARPKITAEIPTVKATIAIRLLISFIPLSSLFTSKAGDEPIGVRLVVLA